MTEIAIYLAFVVLFLVALAANHGKRGRGLTPTRSLRSSDIAVSIRARQRGRP